nr:retrovirus-related Pol polyprotein from transposon TNT 1-94 [Tanacetum cinerariifolium]
MAPSPPQMGPGQQLSEQQLQSWQDMDQTLARTQGLWYLKDTAMALTAYADANHAGCKDTRRSTSESAQFLVDKLVSWSSKKQRSTAISTTEAEYIALSGYTMADMNIPATNAPAEQAHAIAPPTRTDDQIFLSSNWVPISKGNYVLDVQKYQRNLIFPITVAILKNTNFFRAFIASSTIPDICIQQFWDTIDALDITPTNDNNPFVVPPSSDTVIEYVNTLGYPSTLRNVLAMSINALYQPWRAILFMINMCLIGKTAGFDRPRHHVLQILWGIIRSSNIDYTKRTWEEFVQSIQTFFTDRKNLVTAYLLIPSIRFTKLIIHHLKIKHNIHPRSGLTLHYSYDESILNTLKYVGKDGREVFEGGATKSSKSTKVTKHNAAKATKPASAPKPKPAPTQPPKVVPEKKQKLVQETPDEPSLAKRSKASGPAESPSLDVKLALIDSETESDDEVPKINIRDQDENLKPPSEDPVIPKEPARSTRTLSSLQNLKKELSFTDQFFVEKQQEEEPGKTNAEAEVQSMASVPIHQDTSSVPPMTTPVIDLTTSQSGSPLPTSSTTTSIRIDELEQHMANLLQYNLALEERLDKMGLGCTNWRISTSLTSDLPIIDIKETLQQQMFEDKSYEAHEDHKKLYDALEKSLERDYSDQLLSDLEEACQKKRKRRDVPRTPSWSPPPQPPPPPPLAGAFGAPGLYETQELSPTDSLIPDDSILDEQVHLSEDEDSRNDHLPTANSRKGWWKPLPAEKRLVTPEPTWTIPSSNVLDVENNWATAMYYRQVNKTKLTQADLEGQAYEVVKAFYPDVINLQFHMEEYHKLLINQVDWTNPEGDQIRIDVNRPLPLGDPPSHVIIQSQLFFNKDLEYLRHGSKGSSPALSISKMKATSYSDFDLKLLMPEQMWIEDVCTYDISAKYGISHWWFNQQKFYNGRHDSPSRQKEVRSHMRILNVVRIKAYSRYGYDYLSEIILQRADLQEHMIAEKDFKKLHLSDFKDLNLLLLQDFQLGIESYQTHLNLTKPGWDAAGYEFKHDYTIIESSRAIVFPVNNNKQKIMRFNEIYKFSDGTLTWILEALAYKVKEFKIKRLNSGMKT